MNITGSKAFSLCNNVLMYADRIVITSLLQKRMLKEFREGHLEISWINSLMKCYTYRPKRDQDIEDVVKSCRGCALAAKALPIKFQTNPKNNVSWSRINRDFAGPLNRAYYPIVVENHAKCPEILKCGRPTSMVAVMFFTRFLRGSVYQTLSFQTTVHNSQRVNLGYFVNH